MFCRFFTNQLKFVTTAVALLGICNFVTTIFCSLSMSKRNKLKRVVKRSASSLLVKLTLIFVVFIFLQNGVQLIVSAASRDRALRSHFIGQVSGKMAIVDHLNKVRLGELDSYVANMPRVFPSIDSSLTRRNYQAVADVLAANVKVRSLSGFILMDDKLELASTSYASFTRHQLDKVKDLMRYVSTTPTKSYTGYADVLGEGMGLVAVHVWPDASGADAAVVLVCYAIVEDDGYLTTLASVIQAQTSVYRDQLISATSYDCRDIDIHGFSIPQEWVADSLKIHHKEVMLAEKAGTSDVFSSYMPMFDFKGRLLGIQHIWLDMGVQDAVGGLIRRAIVFATVVLSALFIWLFFLLMRRTLIRPLMELRDSACRIASGDLSGRIVVRRTHDEVQQLAEAMDSMHSSLRHSVEVLTRAGLEIQKTSAHIGQASQRLSNVSCRQAANIEEVTSSLAEVGGGVKQLTGSAAETDLIVVRTREAVAAIADKSTASMNATRRIQGSLRSVNLLVAQTNVLSLNAAVEAARAGAHGRGFSVVARSVSALAEQTRHAAIDMAATSEASIAGAENINRLIDDLIPQIQKAAESVRSIARVSKEQEVGLSQISAAAESLNGATQETAADAEELAASAQELAAMAVRMKNLLDAFSL